MSTDAGTQPAGNGAEPAEPPTRRGLRDHPLGKIALLAVVLLGAVAVSRTCGSNSLEVSQSEAIAIAREHASFVPCAQESCVQIRYVPRGIPVRGYWGVVLAEQLNVEGQPSRIENFLVNVETGAVTRP